MKKLLLISFLALLVACEPASFLREAHSTVGISPPIGGYEEGSWTPSVGGTASYTTQSGSYIKIGRLVRASAWMQIAVIGTGSTTIISGLPFASATSVGSITTCAVNYSNLSVAVNDLVGHIIQSSSTIQLLSSTAIAVTLLANPVMTTNTSILLSCVYYTQ